MLPQHALCFVAALWFALAPAARAQTSAHRPYAVDTWNTDDGLPQTSVNAVLQTRDGYLWVATLGGIARFDGAAFIAITTGDRTGLPSDRAGAIAEDTGGGLWIATDYGLARYENGRITTLTHKQGLPEDAIRTVAAHADGSIWFATANGGVGRLQDGAVELIVPPASHVGLVIIDIAIDPRGTVWLSSGRGLWRVDPISFDPVLVRKRSGLDFWTMAADPREGVWVPSDSGIAHVTSTGTREYGLRRRHGLDTLAVRTLATSVPHVVWLATAAGEVWRVRVDSGTVQRIATPEARSATDMLVDREGSVWLGSRLHGLARLRPALFQVFTQADGLAADNSVAVYNDSHGRMWAAAKCDGVSVFEDGRFRRLTDAPRCVWSIAEADGKIWVGGSGVGYLRNGEYVEVDSAVGVRALLHDARGTLWIGTERGLRSWDGERFRAHAGPSGREPDIRTLLQTNDGVLWAGAANGLLRYDNGRVTAYTTEHGLPYNDVRALYEDSTHTLWIATYGGGLAQLRNGRLRAFTTTDGLFDNFLSSIFEDNGNLWFSGNRGVFRIARRDFDNYEARRISRLHSVAYGRADGMISAETNGGFLPAVTRDLNGRLWYPTLIGVAVIDPATARQNIAPAVTVERVDVDGKPVSPAAPGTGLRVGPGASDVELSFAGLSLNTPSAVTFRYKLENWDVNWIDAGTRRTAYYSRLAPGKYTFQVMAANRDGVWSPATTLPIEVLPRFWQTWWFRILGALVLAVSGISWYRMRVRQVRAAAEASQRESTQRRIAAILESITNGFVALDDDWTFTYVNQAAEELLRKPRAELIGRNIWDIFPRAHENVIGVSLRRVAAERVPFTFEAPDVPGYGRWIEVHANPADEGVSVYFSDITTRKQAEETLRSQSLRDELTGVFNRRGFSAHAEQHTRAAHRSGQGFHIVFIDMDGMKLINDTLGHPAGDQALLDVVQLLRRTFREADVIGRLGGDEFAVLAVESTTSSIERVCERLRHNLDRHNTDAHRAYSLSLSIGVSRYDPLEPLPIEELIDLADQRMYEEKRARNAQRA